MCRKHTGTFGLAGILSYNGNKTITTVGGGMIITDDEVFVKRAKHITTTAKVPHPWVYYHEEIVYNYRLTNINAALGVAQLEKIDNYLPAKRKLSESYKIFFVHTEIQFIPEPENARSNYRLNCILLPNRHVRDTFLKRSNENGVITRPVWQLMNRLPMFKNAQTGDLTNSKWITGRLVNIPSTMII